MIPPRRGTCSRTDRGEEAVNYHVSVFKYGLSWKVVPLVLFELLEDPDPNKSGRVMQAMLAMNKIDIAGLRAASDGA